MKKRKRHKELNDQFDNFESFLKMRTYLNTTKRQLDMTEICLSEKERKSHYQMNI
jgi:hypothetical protein